MGKIKIRRRFRIDQELSGAGRGKPDYKPEK
jgi:hypothetical protein